ncbi:O-methyltransferase [Roseiterribacter gracilis]|uniref:O-methyltransferase n=1 Tax=Roseiterribacter gracilis TaxID=2812848 RepID=A0A8S8XAU2_9PROT|nr:O-methyltransferase [Rhodospirillales bacterium TMPK1]
MSRSFLDFTPALGAYLDAQLPPEPAVEARLRAETAVLGERSRMQIGPDQAQLMRLLVLAFQARRIVEIGTFTGYSALIMAGAMPTGGKLITCDVEEETTAIAHRYWREAGVADRIESRLGPAIGTLDAMLAKDGPSSIDLIFIDADKPSYDAYYERSLKLLRVGGLLLIDNTLWSGKVADPSAQDESTSVLRALNEKIARDTRVTASIVPIGDGLTVAVKN